MEHEREKEWLLKEKYNGTESPEYLLDRARLDAGEPLAYVIGFVPFLDTKIVLDSHPLIPRPETEWWTNRAIERAKALEQTRIQDAISSGTEFAPLRILDLCAGSGAIGVAVAIALPLARVDFAELDVKHHKTITDNVCNNGIDYAHTRIFGGNLFEQVPTNTHYDMILSNPPYIDPMLDRAETSVKAFEPHLALYGGKNGTDIIDSIISRAPEFLSKGGQVWIEHEPEQSTHIHTLAKASFVRTETMKDQYGVERVSILYRE